MDEHDRDEYAVDAYGHHFEMNGMPILLRGASLIIAVCGKIVTLPIEVVTKIFARGKEYTPEQWEDR